MCYFFVLISYETTLVLVLESLLPWFAILMASSLIDHLSSMLLVLIFSLLSKSSSWVTIFVYVVSNVRSPYSIYLLALPGKNFPDHQKMSCVTKSPFLASKPL